MLRSVLLCAWLVFGGGAIGQVLPIHDPSQLAEHLGRDAKVSTQVSLGNDFSSLRKFKSTLDGDPGPMPARSASPTEAVFGFLSAEAAVGVQLDQWAAEFVYRRDIYTQTNQGTIDFIALHQGRASLPVGSQTQLQADILGHEFRGLRLSRGWHALELAPLKIKMGTSVSLLQGYQFRQLSGQGDVTSTRYGYQYNGYMTDMYSNETYPYIREATPQGQGFTSDWAVDIDHPRWGKLKWIANDVVSSVRWSNIPHTELTATPVTPIQDAYGYMVFNPAISGKNDLNRRSVTERIPVRWTTEWAIPVKAFTLKAGVQHVWGNRLPYTVIQTRYSDQSSISIGRDFRFNGWRVDRELGAWNMGIAWSRLPMAESKALGFFLSYSSSF